MTLLSTRHSSRGFSSNILRGTANGRREDNEGWAGGVDFEHHGVRLGLTTPESHKLVLVEKQTAAS